MYKISEATIQLIEAQNTSLSCTCINGGKRELGLWQAVAKRNTCAADDKHHVSSLFLNECAQNLRQQKVTSKQQAVVPLRHNKDRASNRQQEPDESRFHQFTHELSLQNHIISYRKRKNLTSTESGDEAEREKDVTNPLCSPWVSKEITMTNAEGNCNLANNALPSSFKRSPTSAHRIVSGAYTPGPFYPALYGRIQSPLHPDPNKTLLESHQIHPIRAEIDEQNNHWVPGNAVYQFRQPSLKSYHSVCCYDSDVITYQGIQRGFLNRIISPNMTTTEPITTDKKKNIPAITNLRSQSGHPIALVRFDKENDLEHNDPSYGKLLQGKLKFPSTLQSTTKQSNPLIVHSSSPFKQSQATVQPSEERNNRPKYIPKKQESVQSIPSSKTNLPNLEVRPTSSIPSAYWDPSFADDKKHTSPSSVQKSNSSDIVLTSPVVMNKCLQSKIHCPLQEEPQGLVRAISAKLRRGPQNSYFNATLSRTGTKELLNFPATRKPQNRDLIFKSFQRIPKRHKLISLRNLNSSTAEPNTTTVSETKETSECAFRSQQRRRRHRKAVATRPLSKKTEGCGCVYVKNPIPKVYIKGKAKALIDFLPNQNVDTSKLTELYYAE